MSDDSPPMIPGWRRKPVVKVRLYSKPSKRGTHDFMVGLSWAMIVSEHLIWCILFRHLLSIQRLQWPDISRSSSVSGDDDPFLRSYPAHNVIHPRDDWDFGKTHHCFLKVLSRLQCLHRLLTIIQSFISTFSQIHFFNLLTSLTSQLTGDLRNRKADTTFFHQFHKWSLPDDHTNKQTNTDKSTHQTFATF